MNPTGGHRMVYKATSLILVLVFLFSGSAVSVQAASGTTTITDCSDSGLTAAINAANAYNNTYRIYFDCPTKPATIKLNSEKFIKGVVIIDGGGQVTLDGQDRTRIFNFDYRGNFFISNMTLQHGYASPNATYNNAGGGEGGAIFLAIYSSLHINNVIFSWNEASSQATGLDHCPGGGAIALRGINSVEIVGSQFDNNTAMNGGAIFSMGGLTIRNTIFSNNHSKHKVPDPCGGGGAIFIDGTNSGKINIDSSTFTGNTTNNNGGAIFAHFYTQDQVSINNTIFSGNQAVFYDRSSNPFSGSGGAIWLDSLDMVNTIPFTNSTIENNSANGAGGGIYSDGVPVSYTNVTFDGNKAQNSILSGFYRGTGGGIAISMTSSFRTTTFTNVSLTHNYAAFSGGGIIALGKSGVSAYVQLANTLLSDNTVGNSRQAGKNCQFPYDSNNPVSPTPFKDLGGNVQYPGVSGAYDDTKCTKSITVDQGANVGSLAGNEGIVINDTPMQTVALLKGSAAIEHGNPAYCPMTDQRRYYRSGVCDTGAYEYNGYRLVPSAWLYLPLLRR
jgi:predicted outer membrane repeat protein